MCHDTSLGSCLLQLLLAVGVAELEAASLHCSPPLLCVPLLCASFIRTLDVVFKVHLHNSEGSCFKILTCVCNDPFSR